MQTTKKKKILYILAAMILFFTGMTIYTRFVIDKTRSSVLTDASDRAKVKQDAISYMSTPHTSDEIEAKLLDAFSKLERDDCTQLVDTYLYGTYNSAAQYQLSDSETNSIYAGIDQNGVIQLDQITDEALRKKMVDLAAEHIVVRYVNGTLFWDVDYGYFQITFGTYINPDYNALLALYEEEKAVSYCNESETVLHTEVVEKRLNTLYQILCDYPSSTIREIIDQSYSFYKAVYFGGYAQDYIYEDGSIKKTILESYRSYAETCPDPQMVSFIKELITSYEEAGLTRTVPIYESVKKYCGLQ